MATEIQLKRSYTPGQVPGAANVLVGEPVLNLVDRVLYTKDNSGNIIVISSGNASTIASLAFNAANVAAAYTVAGVAGNVSNIQLASGITSSGLLTTANISELTNLYFTNARARESITVATSNVSGKGSYDSATGVISINAANVSVSSSAPTNPYVGDLWIHADTAVEYLFFGDGDTYQWVEIGEPSTGSSLSTVAGVTGDVSNVQLASGITQTGILTTANVTEVTNQYFTNARAVAALTAGQSITIDANGRINSTATGGSPSTYGDSNVQLLGYATNANVALKANIADLKTASVAELTNLYFTNARVYSNVTQLGYITSASLSGYATNTQLGTYATNAQLGSYATNAQLASYATNAQLTSYATTTNVALKANIVDLTTANVTENTNQYFTNARAIAAITNTTLSNLTVSGNITLNGQPTTYGVVNPDYINAGRRTSDQTSAGNGSDIIFNSSIVSSGISLNTSTGVFTLTAGKRYRLFAELSFTLFSTTSGFIVYDWVDATTNTRLDTSGVSAGVGEAINRDVNEFNATSTTLIYTPTTNQTVKVRIVDANGTVTVRADIGTKAIIEQLNPTIAVQATATGTVAATVVANTSPNSTTTSGGSSTSPALTVLTVAIPSAGTWRLDAELRVYVPGAGYMAAAFYDNGTLISGSEYFVAAGGVTQTGAATGQYGGFMSYNLTTTGARTVTLGFWSTTSSQFISSEDGRTWLRATQIDSTFALNTLATMATTGNVSVGGDLSVTGNVTGPNLSSKTTGSWTVTTGTNTYSITVPANGAYQIWVRGNIPNGIIAYNATATVTNTNVPVVGQHFAWVYNGGGTPIDFTSIPNQFIGTSNTIVRSSVAPSATTNRFDFGINNSSGSSQTVYWGYVTL